MTTEDKALAMVREEDGKGYLNYDAAIAALCRAIEQHEEEKAAHVDQLLVMDALTTTAETQREAAKQELNDFKQKVSDAMKEYCKGHGIPNYDRFIIPAPKPDPLVEVLDKMLRRRFLDPLPDVLADEAHWLRASLDARGLEIREKNNG